MTLHDLRDFIFRQNHPVKTVLLKGVSESESKKNRALSNLAETSILINIIRDAGKIIRDL